MKLLEIPTRDMFRERVEWLLEYSYELGDDVEDQLIHGKLLEILALWKEYYQYDDDLKEANEKIKETK